MHYLYLVMLAMRGQELSMEITRLMSAVLFGMILTAGYIIIEEKFRTSTHK